MCASGAGLIQGQQHHGGECGIKKTKSAHQLLAGERFGFFFAASGRMIF
jgi:hypothetical protein